MNRSPPTDDAVTARLPVDESTARRVADALAEALDPDEAASGAVADGQGRWEIEITFRRPPNQEAVRSLVAMVAGRDLANALLFEPLAQKDWVAASLAELQPVLAGRFIVHGAHSRHQVPANRVGIEIEAALAFGTGHHGTTRGCLLALDRIAKRPVRRKARSAPARRRSAAGPRILDLGTGTGVLAMAAAQAFRKPVLASDIDRLAVITARANARLNKTARLVQVVRASGLTAAQFRGRARFDLIFANILLRPLQRLAAPLARRAAPGARLVLSGLLPAQASAALASYRAQGLVLEERLLLDGWATLVLVRPIRPLNTG
jgi:ribosomal protein L11 methyltransferase